MSAVDSLLEELEALEIELSVQANRIFARPAARLTPDHRVRIGELKQELLERLVSADTRTSVRSADPAEEPVGASYRTGPTERAERDLEDSAVGAPGTHVSVELSRREKEPTPVRSVNPASEVTDGGWRTGRDHQERAVDRDHLAAGQLASEESVVRAARTRSGALVRSANPAGEVAGEGSRTGPARDKEGEGLDGQEEAALVELARRLDLVRARRRERGEPEPDFAALAKQWDAEDVAAGLLPLEEHNRRLIAEAQQREDERLEELLERAAIQHEAERPWILPEGAEPANPPAGWIYVPRGRLKDCWIAGDGTIATTTVPVPVPPKPPAADASRAPQPPTRCWNCHSASWWRLRPAGPWTCGVCRPPRASEEQIERMRIGSA